MINLINKYVEIQKKLDEECGIIAVRATYSKPRVHVNEVDKFLEIADGQKITVIDRDCKDYRHEAYFIKQNIHFFIVLDDEEYEEIIKIEGVKHE